MQRLSLSQDNIMADLSVLCQFSTCLWEQRERERGGDKEIERKNTRKCVRVKDVKSDQDIKIITDCERARGR